MAVAGSVGVEVDGHLARVTLSHPGKLNAMSRAMWRQLREVFESLQHSAVRCVVVAGDAGSFCAGGDIAEYPNFRFDPAALQAFHEEDVWGGLQAMLDCDVPLIAQIEGACMGAGMEIASCCDLRLAAADARFGAPIARLGFPMAPREARLVAHAAGELTAREMLLAAAVLDAPTLLARGFLNQVLPAAEIAGRVAHLAAGITRLAPLAARMNKQTFRELNRPAAPAQQAQGATDSIAITPMKDADSDAYAYADSAEHREGIAAFIAKRSPVF